MASTKPLPRAATREIARAMRLKAEIDKLQKDYKNLCILYSRKSKAPKRNKAVKRKIKEGNYA